MDKVCNSVGYDLGTAGSLVRSSGNREGTDTAVRFVHLLNRPIFAERLAQKRV